MDYRHLNNITKLKKRKRKTGLGVSLLGLQKLSQKNLVQFKS